ncbi:MAG: membrane-bound lytic murein transglycosylase MltF [bacterium]|nr:membrane-bound lytic murein transglycosylase MltF [bacterium]
MSETKLLRRICPGPLKEISVILFLYLLVVTSCRPVPPAAQQAKQESALSRIKRTGVITLVTQSNNHCYYKYRGRPSGFEYELAKAFAQFLGVELRVQIVSNWEEMVRCLGRTHFLAAKLTPSPSRQKVVDFSDGYLTVQRHIIVHKNNHTIRTINDLDGKTIHICKGSLSEECLDRLWQAGIRCTIEVHDEATVEELIGKVAQKKIDITIADSTIALLCRRYYPDIRIGFPIEKAQSLSWAVAKGERELVEEINRFFETIRANGLFYDIYARYYSDLEVFDYQDIKKYHQRLKTRLPKHKATIKEIAQRYGFDWRLIAAMVYQESHFDPESLDPNNDRGLMQLTSATAKEMGIEDRLDPQQNIKAGVKYLRYLYDLYQQAPEPDRLLISLAAYNVGPKHIRDAQVLARRLNLDPWQWSSLKKTLPLLAEPRYYRQSKYGYCRGTRPVRYVRKIMIYYDILRQKAIETVRYDQQDERKSSS